MQRVTVASKIKEVRKKCGMTQSNFAKAIGVSRSAVSMWELGSVNPTISNLIEIIKVTGVDKDYFSDALASDKNRLIEEIDETIKDKNTDDVLKDINNMYKKTSANVDLADVTKFNNEILTQNEKEKILDYASLLLSARK